MTLESPSAQPAVGLGDLRFYYAAARYWVALMLCILGFTQILRAPATGLLSELDAPLSDINGLRLVLHFYDFSGGYAVLIGLLFVAAAALLLFPKSALVGALLALPILANMAFLAVFFRAGFALTVLAVLLLFSVLFVISLHWPELREAIWDRQNTLWIRSPARTPATTALALRVACVLAAFAFAFWLRSTRGSQDTPLSGAWNVESVERFGDSYEANTVLDSASTIYFEPDLAHLAVLKTAGGRHQARFDVDASTVTLRTPFRQPEQEVFRGLFVRTGDRLTLEGRAGRDSLRIVLTAPR